MSEATSLSEEEQINAPQFEDQNVSRRQEFFDNLEIPVFDLGRDNQPIKKLSNKETAAFGNVYLFEVDGLPVAVKFYKARDRNRKEEHQNRSQRLLKEDYAGLLIAHKVDPNVFVKPFGKVISTSGKDVGLAMDMQLELNLVPA